MSANASDRLAGLFDHLRDTGTELPASNAQLAVLIRAALDNLDIDAAVEFQRWGEFDLNALETSRDALSADFEVIIESLEYVEPEDDEGEDEEEPGE